MWPVLSSPACRPVTCRIAQGEGLWKPNFDEFNVAMIRGATILMAY